MRIHGDLRVGDDVLDDRVGDVGLHVAQHLLPQQHAVFARAAGAVAVHADGDGFVIGNLAAVELHRGDAAADRAARVDHIVDAGEEVVVVVLHLRAQEFVGDAELPLRVVVKVGGGALDVAAQRLALQLEHDERVRVDVGRDDVADGDGLRQALELVGHRAGGDLRAGRLELHGVEEVHQVAAVRGLVEMVARLECAIQMPSRRVEPALHPRFQGRKQRGGLRQRLPLGGQQRAVKGLAAVLMHGDGDGAGVRRAVARLHGIAVADAHTGDRRMLMAREHEVKVELFADAAGLVFPACGEFAPRLQVAFKAAVVEQHGHVAAVADGSERFPAGGNRILDDQLCDGRRVLPAAHERRAGADQAHAQPVVQRVNRVGRDGQAALPVADVAAQAERVEVDEVIA